MKITGKMDTSAHPAVIVKCYCDSLRGYLKTEEKIKKMKDGMTSIPPYLTTPNEIDDYKETYLSNMILVIVYEIETPIGVKTVSDWYIIPQSGYERSMIAQIRKKYKLPEETDEWVGHKIQAKISDNGYFRILRF